MRAHAPVALALLAFAGALHGCGTKPSTPPLAPSEPEATHPPATARTPAPDLDITDLGRCGSPLGAPNRRLTRFELAYAVEDVFGVDASSLRALPRPHASIGYSPDILVGRLLDTSERFLEPFRKATAGIADVVAARIEKECAKSQPNPGACVVERLREPAERLWRATGAADELGALAARAGASSARLLARALVKELLDSPRFYLLENEHAPGDAKAARRRLSSRLALALHGSVPDLELLRRAESGELEGPALVEEIRRLRGDARFSRFSREFVRQWLRADREPLVRPSLERSEVVLEPKRFEKLEAEATESFRKILDGGGSAGDLVADGSGGLLASGLVKSALSAPIRGGGNESWLGRGIVVEEAFLCRTFPLAAVYPPELWDGHPLLDPRRATEKRPGELEMLATRTRDRPCRECHLQLETLGAALEIGSSSKHEKAASDVAGIAGHPLRGPAEVATFVLDSGRYEPCFAKKLLTYLLGRAVLPEKRLADRCLVDALVSGDDSATRSLTGMVERALESPAFREQGPEVVHDTPNPPPTSQNYRTPLSVVVPSSMAECTSFDPGRFLSQSCGTKACHGPGGATFFAVPDRKEARTLLLWGAKPSPSGYCVEHRSLVDLESPRRSLIVQKLVAGNEVCGSPMPITSGPHSLSPHEVACFVRWVEKIATSERAKRTPMVDLN